jgi:hypothetical protein
MTEIISNLNGYVPHPNSNVRELKGIGIKVLEYDDPEYGKSLVITIGEDWGLIEMVGNEPSEFRSAIENIGWGKSQIENVKTHISGKLMLTKQKAEPWNEECDLHYSMRISNTSYKQPLHLSKSSLSALSNVLDQYIMDNPIPIAAE